MACSTAPWQLFVPPSELGLTMAGPWFTPLNSLGRTQYDEATTASGFGSGDNRDHRPCSGPIRPRDTLHSQVFGLDIPLTPAVDH
ncbi:hypothetical protein PM082_014610 [Marasmius tenuissimus]|nr:hypothetical protein PM082_014610 [Marasmius tenuissimus]